jgi:Na+-transporting methylmalonyl-CoA/oxaloacetate decarboxylase beta subunit
VTAQWFSAVIPVFSTNKLKQITTIYNVTEKLLKAKKELNTINVTLISYNLLVPLVHSSLFSVLTGESQALVRSQEFT